MKRHHIIFVAIVILTSISAAHATEYKMRIIAEGWASGINNLGQVVGTDITYKTVIWNTNGSKTTLNSLYIYQNCWAEDINDFGQVTGISRVSSGSTLAVIWDKTGVPSSLGTFAGGRDSHAYAINNNGQVTGVAEDAAGNSYAFVWDAKNGLSTIGTLEGSNESCGLDIDNMGEIVGYANNPAAGFLWRHSGTIIDLSPIGLARAINDNRQVLGDLNNHNVGIWYRHNVFDLGLIPCGGWSQGVDINSYGTVLLTGEMGTHPYIWSQKDGWIDLNPYIADPNGKFYAHHINDKNQVLGDYYSSLDNKHYAAVVEPVPEPSPILNIVCGICFIIYRRRRCDIDS